MAAPGWIIRRRAQHINIVLGSRSLEEENDHQTSTASTLIQFSNNLVLLFVYDSYCGYQTPGLVPLIKLPTA